jgi:hypothetical protein
MRFSIALALLLIFGLVPPATAQRSAGHGGFSTFSTFSPRGLHHLHGRHQVRPFFFGQARGRRDGLPGFGYWGDIPDYWDWGGLPPTYDPAPAAGLVGFPPPRPPVAQDERASVETTPQGVTIIRGPGSRHIAER